MVNAAHFEQYSSGVIQHGAGFKSCYVVKYTLSDKSMPSTCDGYHKNGQNHETMQYVLRLKNLPLL